MTFVRFEVRADLLLDAVERQHLEARATEQPGERGGRESTGAARAVTGPSGKRSTS